MLPIAHFQNGLSAMTLPDFITHEPVRVATITTALLALVAAFFPNLHFSPEQQTLIVTLAGAILGGGEASRKATVPAAKLTQASLDQATVAPVTKGNPDPAKATP